MCLQIYSYWYTYESHIYLAIYCHLHIYYFSSSFSQRIAHMNKAIFLDRDGTINIDKGYVYKQEDFEFIGKAPEAIKIMNNLGYLVIVVTNQSGIARGYFTAKDVIILHNYINNKLAEYNANIDAYYYCPHHPNYGEQCNCRKPKTGLIDKAVKDFNICIPESWLVGDKVSDMECADNAGLQKAFIRSEHDNKLYSNKNKYVVFNDIYEYSLFLNTH